MVVGDVSAQFFERNEKQLAAKVASYLRDFKEAFRGRLGLVINGKKTVVVADEGPVADATRKFLEHTQIKVESTTRLLGVGLATRMASGRQVAARRYAECRRRRGRFRALPKAGARKVKIVRCGTNKARLGGSGVLGVTDGDMRRIRADAARDVRGAARGGSVA